MKMFVNQALPVGLLLASGRGTRFDASGRQNKLLARLPDGRTVIRAAAEHLCVVLDQVIVVVRDEPSEAESVRSALSGLPVQLVSNPHASTGMGTSIAAGVAATALHFPYAVTAGWIIALGDMPFVQPETIAQLCDILMKQADAGIVAPVFRGQRGHPVGFAARHAQELMTLTGDQGARGLLERALERHTVRLIETDDSGILKDIDTPDDLHAQA